MKTCTWGDCRDPHVALGLCKRHWRAQRAGRDLDSVRPAEPEGRRWCRGCRALRPVGEFDLDARGRAGLKPRCRPCSRDAGNAAARDHYRRVRVERPERLLEIREAQRRRAAIREYGEDGAHVHERRERGDGCDCCGEVTARMAVDHNHETGRVRGLLCLRCNTALGLMGDSPTRLRALAAYREVR